MKLKIFVLIFTALSFVTVMILANVFATIRALVKFDADRPAVPISMINNNAFVNIFIGDSTTKYHIDSNYISQILGEPSLNAGVNGYFYPYQIHMVNIALKKPEVKNIFISVNLRDIFNLSQTDHAFTAQKISLYTTFDMLPVLLPLSQIPVATKSQLINAGINNIIDFNYIRFFISENIIKHKKSSNIHTCLLHFRYVFQDVYNCSNNDGYLVAKQLIQAKSLLIQSFLGGNINPVFLAVMKYMSTQAKLHKKHIYLILVPEFKHKYTIDQMELENILEMPIINLSDQLIISPEYWTYDGHLNQSGRIIYSRVLGAKIKLLNKH